MATGAQIRAMLESHAEGDDSRFYAVASQIAATEAKKGHDKLAEQIRAYIDEVRASANLPRAKSLNDSIVSISRPDGEAANLLMHSTNEAGLDQLIVSPSVRSVLELAIEEQAHLVEIKSHGLTPQQTFLFTGPPGCGKTMSAAVVANSLGLPLFSVRLDAIISRYLGESATKLASVFQAIQKTRAVYLFDEFDSLGLERGSGQDVAEMRRLLNAFLVFVESYGGNSIIIAATNHAESLDFALFRRFDMLLEFEMPTADQCLQALELRLKNVKKPKSFDLRSVADAAVGLSFADLSRVCDDAVKRIIMGKTKSLSVKLLTSLVTERKAFLARNRNV